MIRFHGFDGPDPFNRPQTVSDVPRCSSGRDRRRDLHGRPGTAGGDRRARPAGHREIVALSFCAGLRRSEIAALTWAEPDAHGKAPGSLRVPTGSHEDHRLLVGVFARTAPADADRVTRTSGLDPITGSYKYATAWERRDQR